MSICKTCDGMGQHEIEGFSFPYRTQIVDCLDCDGDGSDPRWAEKLSLDELVEHLGEEESDELREEAARSDLEEREKSSSRQMVLLLAKRHLPDRNRQEGYRDRQFNATLQRCGGYSRMEWMEAGEGWGGQAMSEDIVAMARAAQQDERLSDGPLYGKLADEITRLRARVKELRKELTDIAEYCDELDATVSTISYAARRALERTAEETKP